MAAKRKPVVQTYASRKAGGRPIVSFTMPTETVELLSELADRLKLKRSAVLDLAVREFAKRYKGPLDK